MAVGAVAVSLLRAHIEKGVARRINVTTDTIAFGIGRKSVRRCNLPHLSARKIR